MPTARELLEQAEALMQRDRAARMTNDIPTLTDSVPIARDAVIGGAALDMRRTPTSLDDIPMLTEAVDDFETHSIPLEKALDDEIAMWRESPDTSTDVAESSATAATALAPAFENATRESPETLVQEAATSPESPAHSPPIDPLPTLGDAPPIVDDSARWNALAEDIRMQVLQRIDIFTDTGLKDQLNQRLQPIVDRASADLVSAINQHVGQLLRAYVAEAIEREIEKWRENSQ